MRLNPLLLLICAVSLCVVETSQCAVDRKIVSVDFEIDNGPDHVGALLVSEQSSSITVQVPIENRRQEPIGTVGHKPAPEVKKLGLQVWLLKADGSVVTQKSAIDEAGMISGAGAENWFVLFDFAKVPPAEIAGIVFRKNGQLFSQQIVARDWK